MKDSAPRVVIAGNPNTGKSTVFNLLTGGRARIGNYPGITVDRSVGYAFLGEGRSVRLLDSPGTYSLVARSPEEELSVESIAGLPPHEPPDLVVITVDASQLGRNLYLVLQILELGVPALVALNMMDTLEAGIAVDPDALARELGVPVVPMAARAGEGRAELLQAIDRALASPASTTPGWRWRPAEAALQEDMARVAEAIPEAWSRGDGARGEALALWALLSLRPPHALRDIPEALEQRVAERVSHAEAAGRDLEHEIIGGRYGWIDGRAERFNRVTERAGSFTDRVDRVLLHPALGFILFLGLMTVLFQALFTGADPLIGIIEDGVGWVGAAVESLLPPGLFSDFLVHGVIEGVGAFLVFLPQILLLFLFLGILEDSGYMARVAVLMDRIMKGMGLHGRAFVPLLSGYACAVPAILATRTMERRRDRLLTILVLPLMTCSARLPVYSLLIAAMVPPWQEAGFTQGLLMAAMYLFGTVSALVVAWVMSRTVFKAPYIPLVLEMPPYRVPHWPTLGRTVLQRGMDFVKTAGTIILIASIGMWALLSFPRPDSAAEGLDDPAGLQVRNSYAGRLGRLVEPVIEPLGFDWKIGVGVIGAFAAREVFVSTMGVVFGLGEGVDEEPQRLRQQLWSDTWPDGRRVFTPLTCLSLMIFFALACQCMSTVAAARRETGTWTWPTFMFAYMTVLAWLSSFVVYQGGRLLGFS